MANFRKKTGSKPSKKVTNYQSAESLKQQMLYDLEQKISLHLGNFLVLTEEGTPTQIALAHQKAKSEFRKFGPEMTKIAGLIGGEVSEEVADFLDSVDAILYSSSGWIDDQMIAICFSKTEKLKKRLMNNYSY